MTILTVSNISKRFGQKRVLDQIQFQLNEAEVVALVGPNGSGKSTLFNIIMNLLDSDSGQVSIDGVSNKDVAIFNKMSFLKDNTVLYQYLSGWDHLIYASRSYNIPIQQLQDAIDKIGIGHFVKRQVSTYSLGMKQQLLLTLAILNRPRLLVMDEPLNGLDPSMIFKIRQVMCDLVAEGTTILMSSHTLSEVDALTEHIFFLKEGKLIEAYINHDN